MSFCAKCGQQRSGTERFCIGCGAEFTDPAPALDDQEPPAEDATRPVPASDVTRMDVDPGLTRIDPPADQPDSFASWYRQEAPGASQEGDGDWQATQTVQASPTQPAGYLPPSHPPPAAPPPSFPPGPPAAPPSRGSKGKGLFIAVAVIVVLAAGSGAYALAASLGKHPVAQPTTQPTVSASTPTAGTTPTTSPPATSSNASPTATPSPTLSLVAISPGVTASAAEPHVETLLSHYFHGINTHNYQEYASTLNAAQLASQPRSRFESGYASTTDSGMTLTALSASGVGGQTAIVTFTSHQSPAQSVDNSACNTWTLNFFLVPHGSGYLIGPEPSGYQPTYADC